MATKRKGVTCYDKAGEDEPLFVLRAQDILAARLVREWADRAEKGGTKPEVIAEARACAAEMELWKFHKWPGTSVVRHQSASATEVPCCPGFMEGGAHDEWCHKMQ